MLIIYKEVMEAMTKIIPESADIASLYYNMATEDQYLVQDFALFLTLVLGRYYELIEKSLGYVAISNGFVYLLKLSRVSYVHEEMLRNDGYNAASNSSTIMRANVYRNILHELREISIEQMAPPDEVLIVKSNEGEVTREFYKQSNGTGFYDSMQHLLGNLTKIDLADTEMIVRHKLAEQFGMVDWSWSAVSRLCWAVGAISGAISEADEERFLKHFTDELTNIKTTNDNQGFVISSCLLHIAAQNPRFLKKHWGFLKLVLAKISTYVHVMDADVSEMACNAFLKICQGCSQELASVQPDGLPPMLETFVTNLEIFTADLDSNQTCSIFKSIGYVLSTAPIDYQERLMDALMAGPNKLVLCFLCIKLLLTGYIKYTFISLQLQSHPQTLDTPEFLTKLVNVLKTNTSVCSSIGPGFQVQFQKIFPNLIITYKAIMGKVNEVNRGSPTETLVMQLFRQIKSEIIMLIETYTQVNLELDMTNQKMVSEIVDLFLIDFRTTPASLREPAVLSLMVYRLENLHIDQRSGLLETILCSVFEPTVPMISQNYVDFPEFRHGFYKLLRVFIQKCFSEMLKTPQNIFHLLIQSLLWGVKDATREVSHMALETVLALVNNMSHLEDEDTASDFYCAYFLQILCEIVAVLTDPDYRSGFDFQSKILARMLELVQEGEIYVRLYNPRDEEKEYMSNVEFLQDYVRNLLFNAFPQLQRSQIEVLVLGMFQYSGELSKFQDDLQDFLIDIRAIGEDVGDIQLREKAAEIELLKHL
ncbi:Karyopherin transporter [Apophysomyces sp. BC1021]|nr:Karyopherin transporter [Apophysomyces sp. BC1021]